MECRFFCQFFAFPLRFRTPFAIPTADMVLLQCPGLPPSFFLRCFACKFKQRGILGLPTPISIDSIPLNNHRSLISSILNLFNTDFVVLVSRKSFVVSPNSKKSSLIRRPIDGKLDWPFETIPPRLIRLIPVSSCDENCPSCNPVCTSSTFQIADMRSFHII